MSELTREYAKFKQLHSDFLNGVQGAHANLQTMLHVDTAGAIKLMLFWSASCLNFGSSCRTKGRKKFDEVLIDGWEGDGKFAKYIDRLGNMGINPNGGYEGSDKELIYIKTEGDCIGKAGPNCYVFLPMFTAWFEEAVEFANALYPSGIMAAAMQSLRTRALNRYPERVEKPEKTLQELLKEASPVRGSTTHRVKGMPMCGTQNLSRDEPHSAKVEGEALHEKFDSLLKTERKVRMSPDLGAPYGEPKTAAEMRMQELAKGYGASEYTLEGLAKSIMFHKHDDHVDALAFNITNKQETTTMSKTSNFIESVKGVFGNVLRMQRGRAAVHAAKRVIFAAFPIKWGILARLTGKAKKVEDHPLTDVAVALVFHGAANALLNDPQKRIKYLKFTEEMVAASVANAGLKMVPVEEMLDKVMNGALDSEAVGKLKAMLQDGEE